MSFCRKRWKFAIPPTVGFLVQLIKALPLPLIVVFLSHYRIKSLPMPPSSR